MWGSKLEPSARLVLCALMSKADNDTAEVAPEHSPSLTTLAEMTGLAKSAVAEWLNALEDAGWVKRIRGASRTARTIYALLVGGQTAARRPRPCPPDGQAKDPDVSEFGSPHSGLVRTADKQASPHSGQELVRQEDAACPPSGPASLRVSPTEKPTPETPKSRRGTRIPADFHATAEMIEWAREHTPNVGARETEAFIDYWRAVSGQRGVKLDWPATWRNWMRKTQSDFERHNGRAGRHQPYRNPADPSAYHGEL